MATPTQPSTPGSSPTSLPSPSPSTSASNPTGPGSLPPTSLCLYIISILLALFVTILGALVTRSVRRRRQRNTTALASESKPVLWEAFITPGSDGEKGWSGLLPVAGVMSVPATEAVTQHPASKRLRLRFPSIGTRRSVAPYLPSFFPSIESPTWSPRPTYLTVLVSMPTPPAHGKVIEDNRGPPVVELGVAQVTYTPNVS